MATHDLLLSVALALAAILTVQAAAWGEADPPDARTAHDAARFYQMLLNGGQLDGKRYLSEAAVKQMTSRQTPPGINDSYGFGIGAGNHFFGHGGAYSTNSWADTARGQIFVWLVQHAGFPGEGAKAQDAFKKAAFDAIPATPGGAAPAKP